MSINAFIALFFVIGSSSSTIEEATKSRILELAGSDLEQHLNADEYQFDLVARWIPGSLLLVGPENIHSVKVSGNVEQYTRFVVTYQTRAGRQSAEIQLKVEAEQFVAVALDRIKSNEAISISDFELRWVPVKLGRDRFVSSLSKLQNKSIRRSLLPGQPVRAHEISSPILVIPGQQITMIYKAGAIELGLDCESRQSGSADEDIQIYCQETRKKYTAKILGTGAVQWLRTH